MKQVYTVAAQVAHDAVATPQALAPSVAGIDIAQMIALGHLAAQVIAASIGGIEAQLQVIGSYGGQGVGQITAVASQSGAVAHDALGVKSYYHIGYGSYNRAGNS